MQVSSEQALQVMCQQYLDKCQSYSTLESELALVHEINLSHQDTIKAQAAEIVALKEQLSQAASALHDKAAEEEQLMCRATTRKKWDAPEVPAQEPQPDGTEPLEYPDLLPGMVQPEGTDLLAFGVRIEEGDLGLVKNGNAINTVMVGRVYTKAMYKDGYIYARPRPVAKEGQADA